MLPANGGSFRDFLEGRLPAAPGATFTAASKSVDASRRVKMCQVCCLICIAQVPPCTTLLKACLQLSCVRQCQGEQKGS